MRDLNLPLPVTRAMLRPIFWAILNARLPFPAQRTLFEAVSRAQPIPEGAMVRQMRLGGRAAERISFEDTADDGAVLYLHGGGYTIGSITTHRTLAARLAREAGFAVYILDYRLAPEHPYPAALDDAEAAFVDLMALTGCRSEQIAISGDSAGGGPALGLAQRLVTHHGCTPAGLGLIAPVTDPTRIPDGARELVLNVPWMRACATAYVGDGDPADPRFAPLLGEMRGLPPTYVQVDVSELLHGQCVDLVAALRAADVPVRYTETRGMWHVAQLQAALTAPAATLVRELGQFLRSVIRMADLQELD
ncbi:alpha/beta hydrolase [Nocardia sp. CNY236]|uniref:alpha/beta hydrolase n=1 Tax=Nocardia sp. CNY236 TaxID=1169152 RepID=UPI00041F068C|nr:alpha/beta hydrolase [Nocardia sp. CNY236]